MKIKITCPDCKQQREISREATRVKGFTGRCSSCAARLRIEKRYPGPQGLKVEVQCPDCKKHRKINKASTQCGNFTGLCMVCARKRAYAKTLPPPIDSYQPVKKQWCLKCEVEIPYDPFLRLCESCRLANARYGEDETYGETVKVKVGYSVW
jgi:hypothetical protein